MRRPMDILLPKGCGNEEKMSVIEKIFGTHSSRELKRIGTSGRQDRGTPSYNAGTFR